jgi:site-specific DNA-methyltransferase (adenine-specific)
MRLYEMGRNRKNESRLSKFEWRQYSKSIWVIEGTRRKQYHPAPFPFEIPYRLIKIFSFVDDTVLDPFAGQCTTMLAAYATNRNSICVDSAKQYLDIGIETRSGFDEGTSHDIRHGDARDLSFIEDGSVDLIVTSPPYFNKVDYDDESGANLGDFERYEDFLLEMGKVWKECFRVLKQGGKLCINTADVHILTLQEAIPGRPTEMQERVPIHADYIAQCRALGFRVYGEIIWVKNRYGMTAKPIFGSYPYPPTILISDGHEYITVYRKS